MTNQQPPRVATWLGQHLVSGPRRESLLGDLIEQYQQGRSGAWYWRQVIAAILVGIVHDVAAHKVLVVRALVIGWTLYVLFSFPVIWTARIARSWVSRHIIICDGTTFWCQFWRNQLSAELLIYLAAATSGWIVARLHRTYAIAALALYAGSVLLWESGMTAWAFSRGTPIPISHTALIVANLTVLGRPLSILVGGLWAVRGDSASVEDTPAIE